MQTFRTRIIWLLLAIVATTQLATMIALVVHTRREAETRAGAELQAAGRVLTRFMEARAAQLSDAVHVMVADFGFKEAVTSGERETIRSALANSAARIDADLAAFFDDTGHTLVTTAADLPSSLVIDESVRANAADRPDVIYRTLSGRPYLLVIAPVRAPLPVGWAAIGFRIDARLAAEMRTLLGVDISYYESSNAADAALVSTLTAPAQDALRQALPGLLASAGQPRRAELDDDASILLVQSLGAADGNLHAVLQTSLAEVLRPFDNLRNATLAIAALAMFLAIPLASLFARQASRPLDLLVSAAQRIETGDYSTPVAVNSTAEFSSLATTLNSMQKRIAEREQHIREQATRDDLTGLPNRALFRERVAAAIEQARRHSSSVALLLVDVHDFEQINASFGHEFGDEVVRETGRRLAGRLRGEDIVARASTSQFLVLLPRTDEGYARVLAAQIIESVRAGLIRDDVPISLDANVGICVYPAHGATVDELLRRVDTALYDTKQASTRVMVYEPGREEGHRRQLAILGDLRRAIASGELELHYQPKVHMLTQRVQSLEALVRWNHPRHGRIPPSEFVPLAERAGSIILLTSWVLKTAQEQLRAWTAQGIDLEVSVNLSAGDLGDPELPELVRNRMRQPGSLSSRLVLEITESAVMHETTQAVRVMEELRHDGVRFSIDDYGTGYSSLAQLKRLPVDEIKIDKSFVIDLKPQSEDAVIVRSTIELGHSLGVKVVAEGVETAEAWETLRQMGCDMAQGYFISPPLPGAEVVNWVRALNSKLECAETPTQQVRVLREHRGKT